MKRSWVLGPEDLNTRSRPNTHYPNPTIQQLFPHFVPITPPSFVCKHYHVIAVTLSVINRQLAFSVLDQFLAFYRDDHTVGPACAAVDEPLQDLDIISTTVVPGARGCTIYNKPVK